MTWKEIGNLGIVGVLVAWGLKLFFEYLRWQVRYLADRSLEPLNSTVEQFKVFVSNHLEHQQQEHKAIMESQERQADILNKILREEGKRGD